MLSVSILEMYAEGFESLVKLPKFSFRKTTATTKKTNRTEATQTEERQPRINFFAGPNNVFEPDMEAAL